MHDKVSDIIGGLLLWKGNASDCVFRNSEHACASIDTSPETSIIEFLSMTIQKHNTLCFYTPKIEPHSLSHDRNN